MKNSKILVLLSGGIDSTTCLAMAIDKVGKENVEALNITYGQKHVKEINCARNIADYYGVNYALIDLKEVMKYSNCSLLEHSTEQIKHQSYSEQLKELGGQGTVDTYVPFRNGLMLSVAASYALSKDCELIYYGAHADDSAGRAYPDCSPQFEFAMGEAIYEGSGCKVRMAAPLINFNKTQVVAEGLRLNAPYQLTWSCYEGKEKACGTCATCLDRKAAFEANKSADPIKYEGDI